jgi:hypothetical protein
MVATVMNGRYQRGEKAKVKKKEGKERGDGFSIHGFIKIGCGRE